MSPRPRASWSPLAASAVALLSFVTPRVALACGGGSGGGGGGGGGAGNVLSAIVGLLGAIGTVASSRPPPASTVGVPPEAIPPSGNGGGETITYTPRRHHEAADYAPPPAGSLPPSGWSRVEATPPPEESTEPAAPCTAPAFSPLHPFEFGAGFAWQSIDASTLRFGGWGNHPVLAQQYDFAPDAAGQRLGMRRLTMLGTTVRASVLLGGVVTFTLSGTLLQQVNPNSAVEGTRGRQWTNLAHGVEGGAELGLRGRLGPLGLRAGVYGGYQWIWGSVGGLGFAGCDSIPLTGGGHWIVAPRAGLDIALGRNVALGAYAGADLLHLGEVHGAVTLAWNGGAFTGAAR